MHQAGGAGGGQGHGVDCVVEREQHAVGPDRGPDRRVGPFVAEEPHHARGVELQAPAPGCHHIVADRLAEPGAQGIAVERAIDPIWWDRHAIASIFLRQDIKGDCRLLADLLPSRIVDQVSRPDKPANVIRQAPHQSGQAGELHYLHFI